MTRKPAHSPATKSEDELLGRIRRALATDESQFGLRVAMGDDAAVWMPRSGYETVATCDWFLQGTHFLLHRHAPDSVGWKCFARAVSDLAAMGAEPRCFLLSLALPAAQEGAWLTKFLGGLRRASVQFHCPVAGGDTTRRAQVLIGLTVLGECKRGHAVLRSAARPGDVVFVTGRLGEAEFGLALLKSGARAVHEPALRKHLYPHPRLAVGAWLASRRLPTAMMDLSDGLSSDLARLCESSGVGARIEEARIPTVRAGMQSLKRALDPLTLALDGGDDYELLFTASCKNLPRIPARIAGVPVWRVGEITSRRGIQLTRKDGTSQKLVPQGWDPFAHRKRTPVG